MIVKILTKTLLQETAGHTGIYRKWECVVSMTKYSTKVSISVNKQKEIYIILLSAKRFRNIPQFMYMIK